jgi:hypothetical protein
LSHRHHDIDTPGNPNSPKRCSHHRNGISRSSGTRSALSNKQIFLRTGDRTGSFKYKNVTLTYVKVCEFGWTNHLRLNPRPSLSLSNTHSLWSPRTRIRYNTLSDRSWSKAEFIARPLSRPWQGKLQPNLAINPSRLVVAAGCSLYSYRFSKPAGDGSVSGVQFEGSCVMKKGTPRRDITSIAFVPDGGLDRTLLIGYEDGVMERIHLIPPSRKGKQVQHSSEQSFNLHNEDLIESISTRGHIILSLSAHGTAALSSPSLSPIILDLGVRGWSSYLSKSYAAFGTSSTTPLVLHSISESSFSSIPLAILGSGTNNANRLRLSAVYGVSVAPPSFPWGASDQILVSGWYDGVIRVHDLRSSLRTAATERGPAPLRSILEMCDPWSFEAIYAISCGGGSSAHIAAGSARHSAVSFWDVRSPKLGWSVHAPGNDSSPVYDLILEGSRLFGATQSRPFVYDFGLGVTKKTYPHLPPPTHHDKNGSDIAFYVTKYNHSRISD